MLDWRLTNRVAGYVSGVRVGEPPRRHDAPARHPDRQRQLAEISSIVQGSLSVSGIMLGHTMGRSRSLTDTFAVESSKLSVLKVRSIMVGRWARRRSGSLCPRCPR